MTPKLPCQPIFRYLGEVVQVVQEVTASNGGDWRQAVATVGRSRVHPVRPAAQAKRRRADPRRVGAASQLDADLADIHSIMRRNIDEVPTGAAPRRAVVNAARPSEAGKRGGRKGLV